MNHRLCSAVFIISACLLAAGCSQTAPAPAAPSGQTQQTQAQAPAITAESDQLFQQGLAAYNQFDYRQAVSYYDQALTADPHNYKALSGKGVTLAMEGNGSDQAEVRQGISLIRQALDLYPDYVPACYDLALALKIDGQYKESISWFKKVIAQEPDNTWSYYGIATIYGDLGQAAEAVSWLKQAAAFDETNVKEAARSQSHFDSIRNSQEFQDFIQH